MPPLDHVLERERPGGFGLSCARCLVGGAAFCSGLQPGDVERLSAIVTQVRMPAAATVFEEGEAADFMFSIASGSVKLYKLLSDGRRQITAFLFPGEFFGLAVDGGHAYTAEAVTPAVLCRFPRRKLDLLLEHAPRIEKRLLGLAINELAAAHEQMLLLGRKTAREKVATFLMMLSRRGERRGLPASPVALPMGRTDIADYLGLTIETVSRTLTQFKREAVIGLPDAGRAELLKPDVLRCIAEGG